MCSKPDIKMGRMCTPGGAVLGIVGGGVTFCFLNGVKEPKFWLAKQKKLRKKIKTIFKII